MAAQHHVPRFFLEEELWQRWRSRCSAAYESVLGQSLEQYEQGPATGAIEQSPAAEVLFLHRLSTHPRRTSNAAEASLIVVPALLGLNVRGYCGSELDNVDELARHLLGSHWFRRSLGADHVLLTTDWLALRSIKLLANAGLMGRLCFACQSSVVLHAWNGAPRKWMPHVRILAAPLVVAQPVKPPLPWRGRNVTLFFAGQTHGAGVSYMPRRKLVKIAARDFRVPNVVYSTSLWATNPEARACRSGNCYMQPCVDSYMSGGCVASRNQSTMKAMTRRLQGSQYNLAWPGDHGEAAVSSRIYDGFAQGALNVFLGSRIIEQSPPVRRRLTSRSGPNMRAQRLTARPYLMPRRETAPFRNELPWLNMSVIVPPRNFSTAPARTIEGAVADAEKRDGGKWLERALSLIARHAADLLWHHPRSRVANRILRGCQRSMVPGIPPRGIQAPSLASWKEQLAIARQEQGRRKELVSNKLAAARPDHGAHKARKKEQLAISQQEPGHKKIVAH